MCIRDSLGIELYDVQMLAANAIINRKVAEMATGEGKTISAIPAAVFGALLGSGVHVATPNTYLAQRDHDELKDVYEALGLSVAMLDPEDNDTGKKKAAYGSDITYGPGYEFGFDYLRDQLTLKEEKRLPPGQAILRGLQNSTLRDSRVQRGLGFSIIDEIDNVLIDDATSPQVLSEYQPGEAKDKAVVGLARKVVGKLDQDVHFHEPAPDQIELTDAGKQKIHDKDLSIPINQLVRPWANYVEAALRAEHVFKRDVHYVVDPEDGIQIVEASTGRIFADRSWQSGLHQAVEAKESLTITPEALPLATITRQRFYQLYQSLSGMTGSAASCADELKSVYKLGVEAIPLRLPSQRKHLPTRALPTAEMKWDAILQDIKKLHRTSRPVLVGTRTIGESLRIGRLLQSASINFELLNGKQDADEAELISRAGLRGAITIATNLAGRGTDIKLPSEVLKLGGLHVIVSECHSSYRTDRQLIGRCARQGQPGSCQTYVSADDWLFTNYAPWLGEAIFELTRGGELSVDIESKVRKLQASIERKQFAGRLQMLEKNERESKAILGQ